MTKLTDEDYYYASVYWATRSSSNPLTAPWDALASDTKRGVVEAVKAAREAKYDPTKALAIAFEAIIFDSTMIEGRVALARACAELAYKLGARK